MSIARWFDYFIKFDEFNFKLKPDELSSFSFVSIRNTNNLLSLPPAIKIESSPISTKSFILLNPASPTVPIHYYRSRSQILSNPSLDAEINDFKGVPRLGYLVIKV